MSEVTCPLCHHRVSNWEMAAGKSVIISKQILHKSCVMDRDLSIKELEYRIRRGREDIPNR